MDLRRVTDLVTAAILGALAMAMVVVFTTRTDACTTGAEEPGEPAGDAAPVAQVGRPLNAAEAERLAERAAQRAVAAQAASEATSRRLAATKDWVPSACRTGELPYGLCMDLGFPPRAEICRDGRASASERAELRCHEFDR